ncbi:LytR/AlgR family response regulator transcription factor [Chitinophaga ginsengisoli]|uniref:LytTR family two component transcriptional regulator n=1 Tax=Chitinophaga ginsengisoli TaxID=363837 RepID=A0A2P8G2P6_9BACT|nr:LytTR family DNA-binding domain-containing protein [Chitinophaga ginsengisoli]PSL28249.1 LytTR family two component transcriptional regulator [Chitinophaga ginsengisoli]
MNILIIEDEIKAAASLATMITKIRPEAKIVSQLQSVSSSIKYLSENEQPDLIFMDIQLSDGLCFNIFKSVKISCPVVFCTAFEDYTLDAFKANGVDYVLKPFSKDDIVNALKKVDELKNFFQQHTLPQLNDLLAKVSPPAGKKNFLVFKNNKYINISTDAIAFFYIKHEATIIKTFDQEEYSINQSLDQIYAMLSQDQFFRLNRQYLVNFKAIKDVEHYFARKLLVNLIIPAPEKLLINKEKVQIFLSWLENR